MITEYCKQKIKECLKRFCDEELKKGHSEYMYYSPTHIEKTASFSVDKSGLFATDFSDDDKHYDIFTLYALLKNLDEKKDFMKIAEALADRYNIILDKTDRKEPRQPQQIKQELKEEKKQKDLSEYYKSLGNITEHTEAIEYLKSRCITEEQIKKYNILYDTQKQAIIIPCNNYYFKGRCIKKDSYIKHINPQNAKVSLWNSANLKDSTANTKIYITESITDALSLELADETIKTIALNSTANYRQLLEEAEKENYKGYFVLCLDADDTGIKTSKLLQSELDKKGIFAYCYNTDYKSYGGEEKETEENGLKVISYTIKDFNELAIFSKGHIPFLKSFLTANIDAEADEEYKNYIYKDFTPTSEYIKELEKEINESDIYKPTKTNIKILDEALNGGLFAKNLIMLVADTSIGKTAFALQIADTIAKEKPVLYFSLEMSQSELIARSISRTLSDYVDNNGRTYFLNQLDILQGKQYFNTDYKLAYDHAKRVYTENTNGNLFIYECLGDKENTITEIEKKINRFIGKTQQKPIIFIDYLQYIDADEPHSTDKQATDKIIRVLKKTARTNAMPIFAISSTARNNYNQETTLASGKNSGDIEFTADIVLGLNLEAVADAKQQANGKIKAEDKKKIKTASKQTTRDIYISILKNRNGRRDIDIKGVRFTPSNNKFDFTNAHIE